MSVVYISLGSNEGDRIHHLQKALTLLTTDVGLLLKESSVYETLAWGNKDQPDFLNQVICLQTSCTPVELLNQLQTIEKKIGRIRDARKWVQRIIDLDILFYDDVVLNTERLTIPHPLIQARKFVLVPLNEIAGMLKHPVLNKSVFHLLKECKDDLAVNALTDLMCY